MITELELRFFKCFEHLRLPLAPLNLLTGLNASGKSSALQALVLLHQTMLEHEWATRLALNGASIRLGAMPDVVDEIYGRNAFQIALHEETSVYSWEFSGQREDMSMDVTRVAINDRFIEDPELLRFLLPPDESGRVPPIAQMLRNLTYITAERVAPQNAYDLEDPHVVGTVGPRGEHAVSVLYSGRAEQVLDSLAYPGVPPVRLHQVVAWMGTLFPGFALDLHQAPRSYSVTLGLRTSDTSEFHRPIHTGFGLTQCLPIVVAALSSAPGDLLLVENPEVHLHPAGQVQMGKLLAEVACAGIQVIVETHSDHILNGVRRAVKGQRLTSEQVAIHFFRPRSTGDAQVLNPVMDASGNIDEWPEGFFDQIDKDANYFAGWTDD